MLIVSHGLALALLVAASAISARPAQHPPVRPLIEAEQAPNRPANAEQGTQRKQEAASRSVAVQAIAAGTESGQKTQSHRDDGGQEGTEFWPSFLGYRLKITDTLLVLVTLLLFFATVALYRATRRLVREANDSSKKDLRAYVALEHVFFNEWEVNVSGLSSVIGRAVQTTIDTNDLRIRIRNFGKTPAHGMTIRAQCDLSAPALSEPYKFSSVLRDEQMLHPRQEYAVRVPLCSRPSPSATFYVVGRITYRDIYAHWWITDLCYRCDSESVFTPYGDHNRERGPFEKVPE